MIQSPKPRPLFLEVVKHEEFVELEEERDESGNVIRTTPIEGSRTAYLHLRTPDGKMIRAEIAHADLDGLLALMLPDDLGTAKQVERGSVSLDFVAKMLDMTPSDLEAAIKRGEAPSR